MRRYRSYRAVKNSVVDSRPRFYISVTGNREFTDYSFFKEKIDLLIREKILTHKVVLVTGQRPGTDRMVIRYVKENLKTEIFKVPLYKQERGKMRAEFKRNQEIVKMANAVVVFTDDHINVVNDMADKAIAAGKPTVMFSIVTRTRRNYNMEGV